MNICIVEDDENIRELVSCCVKTGGYEPFCFEDGHSFLEAYKGIGPCLIILDIMLPFMSGIEILQRIRETDTTPVIFLTAKTTEPEKVLGLELGADDYVTKPFGVLELLARIKAVLRRAESSIGRTGQSKKISFLDLDIDLVSRSVSKNGQPISLTYKEYELLVYLLENRNIALSRDKILDSIWGYGFEGGTRTVDMHVKTLRQKLLDDANNPRYIKTVRGYGYSVKDDDGSL